MPGTCAVELRNITKRFGSVVANSGIDLEINRGEILTARSNLRHRRLNHGLWFKPYTLFGSPNGVGFTSITVAWLNAAY